MAEIELAPLSHRLDEEEVKTLWRLLSEAGVAKPAEGDRGKECACGPHRSSHFSSPVTWDAQRCALRRSPSSTETELAGRAAEV